MEDIEKEDLLDLKEQLREATTKIERLESEIRVHLGTLVAIRNLAAELLPDE